MLIPKGVWPDGGFDSTALWTLVGRAARSARHLALATILALSTTAATQGQPLPGSPGTGLPASPPAQGGPSTQWPVHGTLQPGQPIQSSVGGPEDNYRTYTLEVPPGATRVLFLLEAQVDLDLFVRYGQPMDDWEQTPDFQAWGDTGREEIEITSTSQPPLQAGIYFVDVGNLLDAPGGPFTLTAWVETAMASAPATGATPGRKAPPAPGGSTTPPATGTPQAGLPGAGGVQPGAPPSSSGGSWSHPTGYYSFVLPAGFAPTGGNSAITIFMTEAQDQLIGILSLPGGGLPLETVAAHAPGAVQELFGPLQMLTNGFQPHPQAGSDVYAMDAMTGNGVYVRTYLKRSGEMSFVVAAAATQQAFQQHEAAFARAVGSLTSDHRIVDPSDGHPEMFGRWEQASSISSDANLMVSSTTYAFYPDGTAEKREYTSASTPTPMMDLGFETDETTSGQYAVLGDVLFVYLQGGEAGIIETFSFRSTSQGLVLNDVPYRRTE